MTLDILSATIDVNLLLQQKYPLLRATFLLDEILIKPQFVALKFGSEVEENTFDQLKLVQTLFPNIPILFKIGGCGARTDIKTALQLGVDCIILPMAETTYAIKNFLDTVESCVHQVTAVHPKPYFGLNIETKTIVDNLSTFLPYLSNFSSIIIGRSDLAASYNCKVDDTLITEKVEEIISFKKHYLKNIVLSIGGKITPSTPSYLITEENKNAIDTINTKHVYISLKDTNSLSNSIKLALEFEILLYYTFSLYKLVTREEMELFIEENLRRLVS